MALGFLLLGSVIGLGAGIVALVGGAGPLAALTLYATTGVWTTLVGAALSSLRSRFTARAHPGLASGSEF